MLFTRMDLLNSQFLDKMNNNIGRLHYEGWDFLFCLTKCVYFLYIHLFKSVELALPVAVSPKQTHLFWFAIDAEDLQPIDYSTITLSQTYCVGSELLRQSNTTKRSVVKLEILFLSLKVIFTPKLNCQKQFQTLNTVKINPLLIHIFLS